MAIPRLQVALDFISRATGIKPADLGIADDRVGGGDFYYNVRLEQTEYIGDYGVFGGGGERRYETTISLTITRQELNAGDKRVYYGVAQKTEEIDKAINAFPRDGDIIQHWVEGYVFDDSGGDSSQQAISSVMTIKVQHRAERRPEGY